MDLDRPRLVLSMASDDKYSTAFLTGALLALRDLCLLECVRVVVCNGQASLVWLWQLSDLERYGWKHTCRPYENRTHLVDQLLAWCERSQEREMCFNRLRRCDWRQWMDPWTEELVVLLQEAHDTRGLWTDTVRRSGQPVVLWAAQKLGSPRALYLSSEDSGIDVNGLGVHVLCRTQVRNLARYLCAGIMPQESRYRELQHRVAVRSKAGSAVLAAKPSEWPLHSGLIVDPLGVKASSMYFMKERLDRLPSGHGRDDHVRVTEEDRSNKLLLLDAFTGSLPFRRHHGTATCNAALTDKADATSAADVRDEMIRAYNSSVVSMYPTELTGDLTPDSYRDFIAALTSHIQKGCRNEGQLTAVQRPWVLRCSRAGYFSTFASFAPPELYPEEQPFGDKFRVSDRWNLHRYFFPGYGRKARIDYPDIKHQ